MTYKELKLYAEALRNAGLSHEQILAALVAIIPKTSKPEGHYIGELGELI